jgi:hypothetical protein
MPHADQLQLSKLCCANYRLAAEEGILTDAFIAANNSSIAVMDAAIGAITNVPADALRIVSETQRAFRYDAATNGIGDITDSNITGLSTVAGLEALTAGSADVSRAVVIG